MAKASPSVFHMSHCYTALVKFLHLRNRSIGRSNSIDKWKETESTKIHHNPGQDVQTQTEDLQAELSYSVVMPDLCIEKFDKVGGAEKPSKDMQRPAQAFAS